MEELSIKIKIGDREYPMKVDAEDEERIRLAGKKINEKIDPNCGGNMEKRFQ